MATTTVYDYGLYVHYKQGDDLSDHLNKTDGIDQNCNESQIIAYRMFVGYINPVPGLRSWGERLKSRGEEIVKLANYIEENGLRVSVKADTHMIRFEGEEEDLEKLVKACDLVERTEMEIDEKELY